MYKKVQKGIRQVTKPWVQERECLLLKHLLALRLENTAFLGIAHALVVIFENSRMGRLSVMCQAKTATEKTEPVRIFRADACRGILCQEIGSQMIVDLFDVLLLLNHFLGPVVHPLLLGLEREKK